MLNPSIQLIASYYATSSKIFKGAFVTMPQLICIWRSIPRLRVIIVEVSRIGWSSQMRYNRALHSSLI